jgi:lycopene cyclase domain-containing protein
VTYTQLALAGVLIAVAADLVLLRVRLLGRRSFWVCYAIVVLFQLVTNGWLTGRRIVVYDPAATLSDGQVRFLGDGRIAFAPVEDLLFGFALVLLTLDLWVFWGRRGVDREPYADGPWQRRRDARPDQAARARRARSDRT